MLLGAPPPQVLDLLRARRVLVHELERSAAGHYNRALILTRLQQYEAALNETQVSISLDGKKAAAWYLQAFVNMQLGRLSDASRAIGAGLLQEPKRAGFHFLAGLIYA